jgi:hypothetical protein
MDQSGTKSLIVYVPQSILSLEEQLKTLFSKHSSSLCGELISPQEIEVIKVRQKFN